MNLSTNNKATPNPDKYVCRLPNGKFVGNLIGGTGLRAFVEVERENACEFFTIYDARKLASDHGARDFEVLLA